MQSSILPAYPPPDVPHALFSQHPRDHLSIPYARQATLAVSSQNYVFDAGNPANQAYYAYLEFCGSPFCGGPTLLPQFGVIMESSFSPIQPRHVWGPDVRRHRHLRPGVRGLPQQRHGPHRGHGLLPAVRRGRVRYLLHGRGLAVRVRARLAHRPLDVLQQERVLL